VQTKESADGKVAMFAKSSQSDRQVLAAWHKLATVGGVFQFKRSESKDLSEIAKELAPEIKLVADAQDGHVLFKVPAQKDKKSGEPLGEPRDAIIGIDRKAGTVFVDVADLLSGVHRGSAMYAIALNFAHNNDLVFIPDPEGVKPIAMKRRTDHMLSSALKFGTTKHMRPHARQRLDWVVDDDDHNIIALLNASADNVLRNVPDLERVDYDWENGGFIDTETNEPVSAVSFEVSAASPDARRAGAGAATLRRGVVHRSMARRAGTPAWSGVARSLLQLSRPGVRGDDAVAGILYYRESAELRSGASGIKKALIDRVFAPIIAKIARRLEVNVVQSADELPAWIRAQDDYDPTVQAVHVDGRVWFVADRISSPKRALELFAHEVVGHYSMEEMLGPQVFAELQQRILALRAAGKWPQVFAEVSKRYERNADGSFCKLVADTLNRSTW